MIKIMKIKRILQLLNNNFDFSNKNLVGDSENIQCRKYSNKKILKQKCHIEQIKEKFKNRETKQ